MKILVACDVLGEPNNGTTIAALNLINALKERGFKRIEITTAGATISSHCGPRCLGILYLNDGEQE